MAIRPPSPPRPRAPARPDPVYDLPANPLPVILRAARSGARRARSGARRFVGRLGALAGATGRLAATVARDSDTYLFGGLALAGAGLWGVDWRLSLVVVGLVLFGLGLFWMGVQLPNRRGPPGRGGS